MLISSKTCCWPLLFLTFFKLCNGFQDDQGIKPPTFIDKNEHAPEFQNVPYHLEVDEVSCRTTAVFIIIKSMFSESFSRLVSSSFFSHRYNPSLLQSVFLKLQLCIILSTVSVNLIIPFLFLYFTFYVCIKKIVNSCRSDRISWDPRRGPRQAKHRQFGYNLFNCGKLLLAINIIFDPI